jgi:phosphate transport system protein
MRSKFDEQLALLNQYMIEMGTLCETIIADANQALLENDSALARRTMAADSEIDRKEREIESHCLRLLLQQQPVARDLRQISSALKMITDMERIGDQAADISEIITFGSIHAEDMVRPIDEMAKATMKMVIESIDAYVNQDAELAHKIIDYDDVVDELFNEMKRVLVERIATQCCDANAALDLLMIAKYFERIGDHATNIAEWVLFSITGSREGDD